MGTTGATRAEFLALGSGSTSSQYWATSLSGAGSVAVPLPFEAVRGSFCGFALSQLSAKKPPTPPRTKTSTNTPAIIGNSDRRGAGVVGVSTVGIVPVVSPVGAVVVGVWG